MTGVGGPHLIVDSQLGLLAAGAAVLVEPHLDALAVTKGDKCRHVRELLCVLYVRVAQMSRLAFGIEEAVCAEPAERTTMGLPSASCCVPCTPRPHPSHPAAARREFVSASGEGNKRPATLTLVYSDALVASFPEARARAAGLRDQCLDVLTDETVVDVRQERVPGAPGHRRRGSLALRRRRQQQQQGATS